MRISEFIGLDKSGYQINLFSLFLHENLWCGYSLELPCPGAPNEYHNIIYVFVEKYEKYQYFWIEKKRWYSLKHLRSNETGL